MLLQSRLDGEVVEWLKALVLKTSEGATLPWVRIPPSPPYFNLSLRDVAENNDFIEEYMNLQTTIHVELGVYYNR